MPGGDTIIIIKPRPLPDRPDYKAACQQTVTLYNVHKFKDSSVIHYHKTVFDKCAFLDVQRLWREQNTGATANTNSLLVIPIGSYGVYLPPLEFDKLTDKTGHWTMRNNDKAMPGIGPDVQSSNETGGTKWTDITDTNYPGTITIKQIDPKRNLAGEICHIEAGG